MDARTLEQGINEKYGKNSDHQIDENVSLIRTFETGEIVILDTKSSANGHHLLKDASQAEIDKIADYFKKLTEEESNELIPGTPDKLTPEQQRQQQKDNELIPGVDEKGKPGDNDLIPD